MNDMNHRAVIGGNLPPPYDIEKHAAAMERAREIADAAGSWMDLAEIGSAEESQMLTDFITGARAVWKEIDGERSAQKKPHDDAGKAVQAAYKMPLDIIERAAEKAKKLQGAWLLAERKREDERKRAAEEEARRKAQEAAAEAARAEAANDIVGAAEAEAKAKEAEKDLRAATKETKVKAESYTGAGRAMSLRTVKTAVIENPRAVFMHFQDDPAVVEVLQRLATAAIRRGETVPGASIHETQVAA